MKRYSKISRIEAAAISRHKRGKTIDVDWLVKEGYYGTKAEARNGLKRPLKKILYPLGTKPQTYKPIALRSEISKNTPLDRTLYLHDTSDVAVPLYMKNEILSTSGSIESPNLSKPSIESVILQLPTHTVQPDSVKTSIEFLAKARLSIRTGTCSCDCVLCKRLGCSSYAKFCSRDPLLNYMEDLVLPFILATHLVVDSLVFFANDDGLFYLPGYRRNASAEMVYCGEKTEEDDRVAYGESVSEAVPLFIFSLLPELLATPVLVHHLNFSVRDQSVEIHAKHRILKNGTKIINTKNTANPLTPAKLPSFIQSLVSEPAKAKIDQMDVNYDMEIDPSTPHFCVQLAPGVVLYTKHVGPTTTLRIEHRCSPGCTIDNIAEHISHSVGLLGKFRG